jgi:hypothetical protein
MIHLVFNLPDTAVLQKAQELDESLRGEIVLVADDYAIGPIANVYSPEGAAARKQWWQGVLAGGDYDGAADNDDVNDYRTVAQLADVLRQHPEEHLWIWAAQNKHDVCGYYWLLPFVQPFQDRVFILYLNNLPFINDKGSIFYPNWLSQIPPKEFLKAKKLARPVTPSEFEVDTDEWKKLMNENQGVRLLEGGKKLGSTGYDFFDTFLSRYVTGDFQKAGRIIQSFLTKEKETTGDAYLLWRLKLLCEMNEWEVKGEKKGMKDFDVKNPAMPSLKKKAGADEPDAGLTEGAQV